MVVYGNQCILAPDEHVLERTDKRLQIGVARLDAPGKTGGLLRHNRAEKEHCDDGTELGRHFWDVLKEKKPLEGQNIKKRQ